MKKKALIFGATGLIGELLVQELLLDNRYQKVIVVVRQNISLKHEKLEERKVDFKTSLKAQLIDVEVDEIYCCVGTTIKKAGSQEAFEQVDLEIPIQIAELAVQNHIKKLLVVSSLGANLHTSNFYLKTKARMEHAVAKNLIETIVFFRPSLLLGSRKEFRFGELIAKVIMPVVSVFLIGKYKKYRAIKAETVAKSMIKVANSEIEGLHYIESNKIN